MKFLCGSCRTKYQISNEKVRGKILTIRCKKCGAKILVRESLGREAAGGTAVAPVADEDAVIEERTIAASGHSSSSGRSGGSAALASAYDAVMGGGETDDMPTSIAPVPANLDKAGVEWYVAIDGAQQGPFAFAELVRRVGTKEVIGRHYVWHDGMDNWTRVRDLPDLQNYLPQKKRPPPMPASSGANPTHPPGGAEVVDFASKRAERQKHLGAASVVEALSSDIENTALDTANAPKATASERAEQLDKVLNEALGIQGEGKTARAEPERAGGALGLAGLAGPKVENVPSIDDLLAFDHKDDLFANLPRAGVEDQVQRESTRFFVAAAGVNRQRKRNKMGMAAGGAGVLAVVLFVAAWAGGVININIPGIGNPFHNPNAGKIVPEEELGDADLDPEVLKKLGAEERRRRENIRKIRQRGRVASAGPTDYINDSAGNDPSKGPRGDGLGPATIDGPSTTTPSPQAPVGDSILPNSGVDQVPLDTQGELSQDVVQRVIAAKKRAVSICYERATIQNEDLRGKLIVKITVEPSGTVSRASIESKQFSGSRLGACITEKIKDWKFPSFKGQASTFEVPFVLTSGM